VIDGQSYAIALACLTTSCVSSFDPDATTEKVRIAMKRTARQRIRLRCATAECWRVRFFCVVRSVDSKAIVQGQMCRIGSWTMRALAVREELAKDIYGR
jgi:hypothetical protein